MRGSTTARVARLPCAQGNKHLLRMWAPKSLAMCRERLGAA